MVNNKRFLSITPFLAFIFLFVVLSCFFSYASTEIKMNFPIMAALGAIVYALFLFAPDVSFNKRIEIAVSGASQSVILYMCFIFLFSTVFTHILTLNGGIQAAINVCLRMVPSVYILPGLFIATSLFSLTIGSSMGCIAAVMPIAYGIALRTGVSPALIAALVVSGSMFGDNLSVVSDTTIAAIQTTRCSMYEKFKSNAFFVLPAFILTLIVLFFINQNLSPHPVVFPLNSADFVLIIPYVLVFSLALLGFDVLAALVIGAFSASVIGWAYGSFDLLQITTFVFDGFYAQRGMVHVFILVLFIAALSKMIEFNDGIEYLIDKISSRVTDYRGAQYATFFLVSLVNMAIVINTISILVTGTVARRIGDKYEVSRARIAALLDIGSCVSQGILPYSPQLLLAGAMANISPLSMLPYLHYQYLVLFSLMVFIGLQQRR